MKEHDLNEKEISDLSDKEFKIMILKMLIDLGRRMEEHRENATKKQNTGGAILYSFLLPNSIPLSGYPAFY